jgi:hypothetical protein
MRSLSILTAVTLALTACAPDEKCSGELYYDGRNCRPCPDDATFEDGRCVCDDSERYRFVSGSCQLRPGAEPAPEPDAGMSSCASYCEFVTGCVGGNPVATGALPSVVAGLHAGDAGECESACEADLAADGGEEVLACFHAGRSEADCEVDDTPAGIQRAFELVSECCAGKSEGLCASICAALTSNAIVANMIDFCD